jgi:hypothetical protein
MDAVCFAFLEQTAWVISKGNFRFANQQMISGYAAIR